MCAAGKQAAFHGIAEYYQSLVSKDAKDFGDEIARLRVNQTYAAIIWDLKFILELYHLHGNNLFIRKKAWKVYYFVEV